VNIASVFVAADDRLLQHLERDSEWLQQQLGQYGPVSGDFVTKCAFEEYKTRTAIGKSVMVRYLFLSFKFKLLLVGELGARSDMDRSYQSRQQSYPAKETPSPL
jgi:hypothetical protein